jgi:hypothetical protein
MVRVWVMVRIRVKVRIRVIQEYGLQRVLKSVFPLLNVF